MSVCGHPTKSGKPCQRPVVGCWQHQGIWHVFKKWFVGAASILGVISFALTFVETPRIKLGSVGSARNAVPMAPKDLSVVFSDEPARPRPFKRGERILVADSAAPKTCGTPANVSQPENTFAGLGGQLPLLQSAGLAESYRTADSVTAIVDRQLASNLLGSQQTPTLSSINVTELNKGLPDWFKAQQIPTITASGTLAEFSESLPDWSKAGQNPILTSSTIAEVSKPLSDWLKAQGIPTLTSLSSTATNPATSGTLGIQHFSLPNSLTGSPDNRAIPQSLNPVVQ